MSRCTVRLTPPHSLLALALLTVGTTLLMGGCATAGSTREVPLAAGTQSGAGDSQAGAQPSTVAVTQGSTFATLSNVAPLNEAAVEAPARTDRSERGAAALGEHDPLARIAREPTGTVVGKRVDELMGEVTHLRSQVAARSNETADVRGIGASSAVQYYSAVGAIQARLQQGTTPGNPILLRQWDEAQSNLDQMSGAVSRLNTVSTNISGDASLSGYLLESIKAALQLSGAVDEDHDHLKLLQDVTVQQTVQLDRMKSEISGDLTRLNTYITTERNNMQTLALAIEKGEFLGGSLSSRPLVVTDGPIAVQQPQPMMMPAVYAAPQLAVQQSAGSSTYGAAPAMVGSGGDGMNGMADPRSGTGLGTAVMDGSQAMPAQMGQTYDPRTQNLTSLPDESANQTLAIIRFADPNVQFDKQLYTAVSGALDQAPNALFTVVAVTPQAGNAAQVAAGTAEAQRHADDVKNSLVQMGIQPARIAMSADGDPDARAAEVHVLVR